MARTASRWGKGVATYGGKTGNAVTNILLKMNKGIRKLGGMKKKK